MNYLKVPDSNIKLTDGSVVMLARFPGTKWVVHYGWYDYSGRRGMGWYFSSIPAQTVIPVTNQDLQLIVLVDPGSSEPDHPAPPSPPSPPPPGPGPWNPPGPGPLPPFPPVPDSGLYPGPPDPHHHHHPSGDPRAFFSKNDQYLLDASWICLPSIRYRDALGTICNIPDGKVVKINNVDGVTRYYAWNAPDNRWDEKFFEYDPEVLLEDYYTKEQIDESIGAINLNIGVLEDAVDAEAQSRVEADSNLNDRVNTLNTTISGFDARFDALSVADQQLDDKITALHNLVDSELLSLKSRVSALEDAVFNIRSIVATSSNTVLVSDDGTIRDSGVSIGDGYIEEPAEYASADTLATEQAVARKVEENVAQWTSF